MPRHPWWKSNAFARRDYALAIPLTAFWCLLVIVLIHDQRERGGLPAWELSGFALLTAVLAVPMFARNNRWLGFPFVICVCSDILPIHHMQPPTPFAMMVLGNAWIVFYVYLLMLWAYRGIWRAQAPENKTE